MAIKLKTICGAHQSPKYYSNQKHNREPCRGPEQRTLHCQLINSTQIPIKPPARSPACFGSSIWRRGRSEEICRACKGQQIKQRAPAPFLSPDGLPCKCPELLFRRIFVHMFQLKPMICGNSRGHGWQP